MKIVVTVGTEAFQFNRLMKYIDDLIDQNILKPTDLTIQFGSCSILPKCNNKFSTLPPDKFITILSESDLVITHCSEGSLLELSHQKNNVIMVPRQYKYGEHLDDHQVELALALEALQIPIAWNLNDLKGHILSPTAILQNDLLHSLNRSIVTHLVDRY